MTNPMPAWCRYIVNQISAGRTLEDQDFDYLRDNYMVTDDDINRFLLTFMTAMKRTKKKVRRKGN